jgi:hypothetical protein
MIWPGRPAPVAAPWDVHWRRSSGTGTGGSSSAQEVLTALRTRSINHGLTKNECDRASKVQIAGGSLGDRRVLLVADNGVRHLAVQAIGGFTKRCGFFASAFEELPLPVAKRAAIMVCAPDDVPPCIRHRPFGIAGDCINGLNGPYTRNLNLCNVLGENQRCTICQSAAQNNAPLLCAVPREPGCLQEAAGFLFGSATAMPCSYHRQSRSRSNASSSPSTCQQLRARR